MDIKSGHDQYRLCEINGEIGYFHRIVEVRPTQIKFRDGISRELKCIAQAVKDIEL